MFVKNISIEYSLMLIMSIGKKSFTQLSKVIKKSRDTVRRMLQSDEKNLTLLMVIARQFFRNSKTIYLTIDDTLLRKIYSMFMEGSCEFFDTKMGRKIKAYKLLIAGLTDGKYFIPIHSAFLYSKEVAANALELKEELLHNIILNVIKLFPDKTIIVTMDGAFATKKFLQWAHDNNIKVELRMHSNRTVLYQEKKQKISEISDLRPKGRHMARTIKAEWNNIPVYITADRRIDKHGEESIVYLVSTYKAKPSQHVKNYKCRWPIEKLIRTCKQHLGLQDCFSTKLEIQLNHVSSVLLSYAIVQIEMKKFRYHTPEDAIRGLRDVNFDILKQRILASDQIFSDTHA